MPWQFGPFELDVDNACLRREGQRLSVRPKTFDVLAYLVTHAGQLIRKDELLESIWPETAVGDGTLKSCIVELRKLLGDQARTPLYIATEPRRGYRFIAEVVATDAPGRDPAMTLASLSGSDIRPALAENESLSTLYRSPKLIVGRETEMNQLRQCFARACQGERQVVFITGEAGIGKTTLVDAFVAQVTRMTEVRIGRGQCIEHYGAGEAYLPLLEALGRLCRTYDGERLIGLLRQHAPTWLVQMPALLDPVELEALQRAITGTTQARMLREMAEALEAITNETPLVLIIEDLQWADYSTVELLAAVARRREAARLVVLSTYRPVDVLAREHPLLRVKQELQLHGACWELPLGFLSEAMVEDYLTERFTDGVAHAPFFPGLARFVHGWTEGNPLFIVMLVDALVQQSVLMEVGTRWLLRSQLDAVDIGVPASLRYLVEQQIEQLSLEEQEVLEAASVAGRVFSAAVLTVVANLVAESVEAVCEGLARRSQFVHRIGTSAWPDWTVAGHYEFIHSLYQEIAYARVPAGRQVRLHQQIGERLEAAYGIQAQEIAAELAAHFIRGRDIRSAVYYLQQASKNALLRCVYSQAKNYLSQSLELLQTFPDTPERARQELSVRLLLNRALMLTHGHGSPKVEDALVRARTLGDQVGDSTACFTVQRGLWAVYLIRAELFRAYELSEELLYMAHQQQDPNLLASGYMISGASHFYCGAIPAARAHLVQALELYQMQQLQDADPFYELPNRQVFNNAYLSKTLWILGYPQQALERLDSGHRVAQERAHPFNFAFILDFAIGLRQLRGEVQAVQKQSEVLRDIAQTQGLPQWEYWAQTMQGWALTMRFRQASGIRQVREGLAAWRSAGGALDQPWLLGLVADLYRRDGLAEEGLSVLSEALGLVDKTAERWYEPELYRLKGELLLTESGRGHRGDGTPEQYFKKALTIARAQQAKSWELRAVTSLACLWQQQDKRQDAYDLLAPVYEWFTERFDTADLQDAKALLDELRV